MIAARRAELLATVTGQAIAAEEPLDFDAWPYGDDES